MLPSEVIVMVPEPALTTVPSVIVTRPLAAPPLSSSAVMTMLPLVEVTSPGTSNATLLSA